MKGSNSGTEAAASKSTVSLADFIASIDHNDSSNSDAESTTSIDIEVFVPNTAKYDQTLQKLQESQRRLGQPSQYNHDEIRAQAATLLYWAESASVASRDMLGDHRDIETRVDQCSVSSIESYSQYEMYHQSPGSSSETPCFSAYDRPPPPPPPQRKMLDPPPCSIPRHYDSRRDSNKRHQASPRLPSRNLYEDPRAVERSPDGDGRKSFIDRITFSNRADAKVCPSSQLLPRTIPQGSSSDETTSTSSTLTFQGSYLPQKPPAPSQPDAQTHMSSLPDLPKKKSSAFSKLQGKLRMWHKQKITPFWKITLAQLLCVAYILVLTFSDAPVGITDPETKDIIDPNSIENTKNGVIYINGHFRAVVAIGDYQKICLAMSRMSAFSMYPMLVVVFITKMKALQSFFAKTPLSMYLGVIKEAHDYHVHAGRYIAFDVWVHTAFHLLRWADQGNIKLLWTSCVGLSGLITVVATPLIAFPMMYYKNKLRYEVRKGLHYLFYVFAVALCFHVPPNAVPNGGYIAPVLGTCIVAYTLDAMYVYIFMTERVQTTSFHVLSSGVRISMPVSERFQKQAKRCGSGYAYICIPWINDKQWHAFSLFEDPSNPSIQQMFLLKNGDWTKAVHAALARETTRPCWIKGPFPSPYSHASLYDNQILVASGIGITPALAAINAFKSSRRINLVWAVRDPEMLEFFLEQMYLNHGGWNLVFYTGKAPLPSAIEERNSNVRVIEGRPDLPSLIPNIVYSHESKDPAFSLYEENEFQNMYVKRLDDHIMSSWGVMYCGGSKPVIKALTGTSIDCNIDLHIDSFAW